METGLLIPSGKRRNRTSKIGAKPNVPVIRYLSERHYKTQEPLRGAGRSTGWLTGNQAVNVSCQFYEGDYGGEQNAVVHRLVDDCSDAVGLRRRGFICGDDRMTCTDEKKTKYQATYANYDAHQPMKANPIGAKEGNAGTYHPEENEGGDGHV